MRVNDQPVTEREFNAFVAQFPEQTREFLAVNPEGRDRVAQELTKLKALEQEGRKLGGERDPEARAALAFTRANLYARFALDKMTAKADEQRVRQEYEKVRTNPNAAEWNHIMVAYQGGQAPPRKGEALPLDRAQAKAAELAKRIRAGAAFADVARAESDDLNSAPHGGAMPGIDASMLPEQARSLKMGEVSDPVVTPYGVHIFKLDTAPIERVRPQIEAEIRKEAMQVEADRIAKTAKVVLDPTFFTKKKAS